MLCTECNEPLQVSVPHISTIPMHCFNVVLLRTLSEVFESAIHTFQFSIFTV